MSTIVNGVKNPKEIIRIAPNNPSYVEVSTSDGRTWIRRGRICSEGICTDLMNNGKELLATTTNGLYFSTSDGRTWIRRGR